MTRSQPHKDEEEVTSRQMEHEGKCTNRSQAGVAATPSVSGEAGVLRETGPAH